MDPARTQDLGVHSLRFRQIYTGPDLTTVYDYDFDVIIGVTCAGSESDLILPTFSFGAEFELSDIVFDHEYVQVFAQGEPFCSGFLSLMQLWPVSNDPWHQRQSIQLISPVAPTH